MTARPSNAPYEPIHHPDLPQPWRGFLAEFLRFCEGVTIMSKELGAIRLAPLWGSQRYCVEEIFSGLAHGLHDEEAKMIRRREGDALDE